MNEFMEFLLTSDSSLTLGQADGGLYTELYYFVIPSRYSTLLIYRAYSKIFTRCMLFL